MNLIEEQGDLGELRNLGNKKHKSDKLKEKVAKMSTLGLPTLKSDEIISIDGVGSTDSGSWYVEKVTHRINSSGGYITDTDLLKNATQTANSTTSITLDKTAIGDRSVSATKVTPKNSQGKTIKLYNINADEL